MDKILKQISFFVLPLALVGNVSASIIDTTSDWNGTHGNIPFGEGYDATYGQTFIVPETDNYLDTWTFYLMEASVDSTDFAFYLMDWDSSSRRATGSILYQSTMVTTSDNGGLGGYEAFSFDLGGLALESGNNYAAFISVSEHFDGTIGAVALGTTSTDDVYIGGDYIWQDNDDDTSAWTASEWAVSTINDTAFTASFSSIPEPSSLALLLGATMGGWFMRRRLKR